MTDSLQSTVRFPEDVKTRPNPTGLGSAEKFVDFVESLAKDKPAKENNVK